MLKYLDKVKVIAETASNGQECTEMVCSKEPGYYSLIIVSATPLFPGFDEKLNSGLRFLYYSAISKCQSRMVMIPVVMFVPGS